jgi:hypothetical protein
MRRTVYNHSGREVGVIVDGAMRAVPAGTPGGGPGTLVCSDRIAAAMIASHPKELTLSAGGYTEADEERMRGLPLVAVQGFCQELMTGATPRLVDVENRYVTPQGDARPAAKSGSPAGSKSAA